MADAEISRGINAFVRDITRTLDQKIVPELLAVAAETGVKLIRERTQGKGQGVAFNLGAPYPLKPLSPNYIEFRRRSSRLSIWTSPGKSNLTFTGQMLEAMQAKRSGQAEYSISISGTRDDGKSNARIAKYVSRTRPFLYIAGGEREKIRTAVRKHFEILAKRNFNR